MQKIPNKNFDFSRLIEKEPIHVKLKSQGVIRDFSFETILNVLMKHFTERKIPFAYSICVSNSPESSVYRNESNLDKLDLHLTNDQFLKDGLRSSAGKKIKTFHHGKETDFLGGNVTLPSMDGIEEDVPVRRLFDIVEQHVVIYDIPFFYLLCVDNDATKSEYYGKCLYDGLRYKLTDNRFRKYTFVGLGFDPYEPEIQTVDMDIDDFGADEFDPEVDDIF